MECKYNFSFTLQAEADVDSVLSYLSENLQNNQAAKNLLKKIREAIGYVTIYPFALPDCKVYMIEDKNVRRFHIDNYVLIYRVESDKNEISFLRFCYAKANLPSKELLQ